MSQPTARAASLPQYRSRPGRKPGWRARRGRAGSAGMRAKDRGRRAGASEEREGWHLHGGGEGELNPLPLFPARLFPRKLYQCGHARRRHMGRLVSRGRARKRVSPAAAPSPQAAALGASPRLPIAPPRTGRFQLRVTFYHVGEAASSLQSPPPLLPRHTRCACGGGGGGRCREDVFLVPFGGLLKQLRSDQELKFQGHNLYLWALEVAIF